MNTGSKATDVDKTRGFNPNTMSSATRVAPMGAAIRRRDSRDELNVGAPSPATFQRTMSSASIASTTDDESAVEEVTQEALPSRPPSEAEVKLHAKLPVLVLLPHPSLLAV